MERSRALFTSCAGAPVCVGANIWNTPRRLGRETSFTFPPYVPHQEINALAQEPLECVVVRSDQETVVVNLDIESVEKPEAVAWVDPIHRRT